MAERVKFKVIDPVTIEENKESKKWSRRNVSLNCFSDVSANTQTTPRLWYVEVKNEMTKTRIILIAVVLSLVFMVAVGVTFTQYVNTQNQTTAYS